MADRFSGSRRRALEMLASVPHGATEATMVARGFASDMPAGLVLAGFATVVTETVRVGAPTRKIERFQITDAGRRAIAEMQP